jgi:hypothetical protein
MYDIRIVLKYFLYYTHFLEYALKYVFHIIEEVPRYKA